MLRVAPDGSVRVSAPYWVSTERVEAFILECSDKIAARGVRKTRWVDGAELFLEGRKVTLRLNGETTALEGDTLFVPPGDEKDVERAVRALYRASLQQRLLSLIGEWRGKLGVSVGKISIRNNHRVWASCSSSGDLSFSLRSEGLPDEDLSYLVLHELAHRIHFNHGPAFHACLDRHMPSWRERRKHLRTMQASCDVFCS